MSKGQVIQASEAKNAFGTLAGRAKGAPVEIMRHGALDMVVISPALYRKMKPQISASGSALARLQSKFDSMVAQMQTPRAAAAYQAVLDIEPNQVGRATANANSKMTNKHTGAIRLVG